MEGIRHVIGLAECLRSRRLARRRAAFCVAAIATGVLPAGISAQTPAVGPEPVAAIEALVVEKADALGIPAVSAAVGTGAEVVWERGFGTADLEHDAPATASTRYRTASITKWMTATAAMRLVEEGKLDLDAPVQEYCPGFPEKRWPLTSRHLLTHRGGVRHYVGGNGEPRGTPEERAELARRRYDERHRFLDRFTDVIRPLDGFKDDPLLFEPGARYRYSSHGYRLLGCVLRGAAGERYDDLMQTHVFDPAGMTATQPDDARAIVPGRASGYFIDQRGGLRRDDFRDVSENLPAGGHLSTPADLVRFALAWDRGELVSEESMAAMTARPAFPNAEPEPDEGRWYGFGVNVAEWEGHRILLHSGGQSGTSTLLVLFPDDDLAVAVMTNVSGQGRFTSEVLFGIAEVLFGG